MDMRGKKEEVISPLREHIEKIRRDRFYIGRDEKNPLAQMVHKTVNYLSEELYSKDVHFLMELIQNAEDNEYPDGVAPSLEFIITSKDVTSTGAYSTLLVFNNERGFSPANIESICGAAMSTKKGNRHRGYIGEKGIGFKSVFLISSQPHIFSNGYQIKFNEEPCPECGIGYIVPEWVENPVLSEIRQAYGPSKTLPTTTIILPLKKDKEQAVKNQLSKMHPEMLLFLTKIKQLTVREDNDDPKLATVSQISISGETDVQMRKNVDAESYTRHLSAQENGVGEEERCSYYMWKQKFPVKRECRVEKRQEVDEWTITLAFPWSRRLNRGLIMPGVYSFLPTEMVTGFPFVIQADFLLSSSRESILVDSPWNKGILECVPSAFVNAFETLVKSSESAPVSNIPPLFRFLPVKSSSIPLMDSVRMAIKDKVVQLDIIPCETKTAQKIFCKPHKVGRLYQAFWSILEKAERMIDLKNILSHGAFVLSSSFDKEEYNEVLNYLGVGFLEKQWYGKCIESTNLVKGVSEEVYMDLLCFLADNWEGSFADTNIQSIPLIKYVDVNDNVAFCSINRATQYSERIGIASEKACISWLISWSRVFRTSANVVFVPESVHRALEAYSKEHTVLNWLKTYAGAVVLDVYKYGRKALAGLGANRSLAIAFTHFLYHSRLKNFLSKPAVEELCSAMPLVDSYGNVRAEREEVLVPARGSKWVGLMGSNPWRSENYVELGADYMTAANFANNYTTGDKLLDFLKDNIKARDVPDICPPNASFPVMSSPLTRENTFLLLDWIQSLRYRGVAIPRKFMDCIKYGSWLKTSVGYKPPSESFLSNSDWGALLQMDSVLVDIPMIDQRFYNSKLGSYKEELKLIGVRFEFGEASTYIGDHLMSFAENSTLTRGHVISLLKLIRVLRKKQLSPEDLISAVRLKSWLKTSKGYLSPVGSVIKNSEWTTASYISNLPFIDEAFYGNEIVSYGAELELLGVEVSFNRNYQLVVDNFKPNSPVTADAAVLILECIRSVKSSERFVSKLRDLRWIKTHLGYKTPNEAFFVDQEWECLLEVVDGVPLVDQGFYEGRLGSYREELKKVGVLVNFEDASKAIANRFKQLSSSSSLVKKNVIALLSCYRQLKEIRYQFPADMTNCMHNEKWLHTKLGFRAPRGSILFDVQWESVSNIAQLPFIDDSNAYYGKEIYDYKDELKALGATVEFKDGAHFVLAGLNFPKDPSVVTPFSILSLLKCIQFLKRKGMDDFPKEFMKMINTKWLKTVVGYRSPDACILFDAKWGSFLQKGDGPFIDEAFYGSEISTYREELITLGVIAECAHGCSLIADHLKRHSHSDAISRTYMYLHQFKWEPKNEAAEWIWIPNCNEGGKWVGSEGCVLHDKDNLFSSQLFVLDKYYEQNILGFFSMALKVKSGPTVEDYCKLWNMWETSARQLTEAECSAFWVFIAKHWNSKSEKSLLMDRITKLPVLTGNGISLSQKQDVFIPDDLLLKDLFDEASEESIFIWYPSTSLSSVSRAKMNTIYSSLGIRTISEAIQNDKFSLSERTDFRKLDSKDTVIKSGLLKIALGFLANPSLDLPSEKRQEIVKHLLDSTVFETNEPVTMSYSLPRSSGQTLAVKASRRIRWEREEKNSKLFIQKTDKTFGQKAIIEFATYFSQVISSGLLFDRADHIAPLNELIKLGCLLDFDDAAIDFLLKSKNLQLFSEDQEFLSSVIPSLES